MSMATTEAAVVTRQRPIAAPATAKPSDRRWAKRRTGVMAGQVVDLVSGAQISCVIRDMSATGARLAFGGVWRNGANDAGDVPDKFVLIVRIDKIEVDCEVVWRLANAVGVRFKGGMRPLTLGVAPRQATPLPSRR